MLSLFTKLPSPESFPLLFAAVEQFAKVQNIFIYRQVFMFSFYCNNLRKLDQKATGNMLPRDE